MPGLALLGKTVGVSGQKGKGMGRVALVLRQMERNPPHGIPSRITALQIRRRPARSPADGGLNPGRQFVP